MRYIANPAGSRRSGSILTIAALAALSLGLGGVRAQENAGARPSGAQLQAEFARARQAADEQDWPPALEIAARLTDAAPWVYDYGLFEARCLGWADRNDRSADAYSRLYRLFPHRVEEFGAEWSRRLLFAGRTEESVRVSTLLMALGADDFSVRENRALALSWIGTNRAAAALYEDLYRSRPHDSALRLAYARNLYWSGQDEKAWDVLESFPEEYASAEELVLRGRLAAGTGRPLTAIRYLDRVLTGEAPGASEEILDAASIEKARALEAIGDARGAVRLLDERFAGRDVPDVRELRSRITRTSGRPWVSTRLATSDDSDDLRIRTGEIVLGWSPSFDTVIGLSYRLDEFEQNDARRDMRRYGLMASWRTARFSARLHGRIGELDGSDFAPLTGTAGVSWTASDRVGVSLGLERVDYESFLALEREVVGTFGTAATHVRPGADLDLRIGAGYGVVDGPAPVVENRRVHGFAEIGRRIIRRPRLAASASVYGFDFSERTSDGYWSPDEFLSWAVGADFNPVFGRFELVLAGSIGAEKEVPGDWTTAGKLTARAIYRPIDLWTLEYRFDASDSKVDSDTGFSRTGHTLLMSGTF